MDAAASAGLEPVIGLWLATKEIDRLAARIADTPGARLESLSHYATEPAAEKLSGVHPAAAAKLYRALGVSLVDQGKSQYYEAALAHLSDARRCYEKAGQGAVWKKVAAGLERRHRRKSSFIDGFRRLVGGKPPAEALSFLERARRRRG